MLAADVLKGLAAISGILGSMLLAWRVSGILKALAFVAHIHEGNIDEITSGRSHIVMGTGATKHVENAQKLWLLYVGFFFLIASGVLNFASLCAG